MKRRTMAAATAALTAVAVIPATVALAASATSDGRTRLSSSAVSRVSGLNFGAAAPASTALSLGLQLPLRNQALRDRLLAEGTVLSPARYAALFAPSTAQISRVRNWATSEGLTITQVSAASGQIQVSAPVPKVNKAFNVKVRAATIDGASGVAALGTPTVPSDLGLSGVSGLTTLRRSTVDSTVQRGSARSTLARPSARTGVKAAANGSDKSKDCAEYWGDHLYPTVSRYPKESNLICGYRPQNLSTMYGVQAAQTKAPAIGILLWDNDPNMLKLTNDYMSEAKYPQLKTYVSTVAKPDKNMPYCDPYGTHAEQSLDVQSSHAIAPNAPIYYYGASSCTDSALTSTLQLMVDQHKVSTISMSFGGAYDKDMTPADMAAWDRPLQQAALTGISTFAASGDEGNNSSAAGNDLGGCRTSGGRTVCTPDGRAHVGYPASSAYTTAVGGTSVGLNRKGTLSADAGWENRYFIQRNPAKGQYVVYDGFGVDGAGGGVSEVSRIPTWQKGVVTGSSTRRAVPDIAALANPHTGYSIRQTFYTFDKSGKLVSSKPGYNTFGGTSLASPIVAAVVGLAKSYNNVPVGNAAPLLYKLRNTAVLRDINAVGTTGVFINSSKPEYGGPTGGLVVGVDSLPQNLASAKGWDAVTGLGEPNGMSFIRAFK